ESLGIGAEGFVAGQEGRTDSLNKKLWLLNLLLAGAAAYGAVQLRKEWHAGKDREASVPQPGETRGTTGWTPLPAGQPGLAGTYAPVAQKFLFDRERNPNVVIEVKPEPPPPPMPALPVYHGMMQIGSRGPVAFLSMTAEGAHQSVHPGDPIGPFKLVAVSSAEFGFDGNGQRVTKGVDGWPRGMPPPAEAPPAAVAGAPAPVPPPPVATGPGVATPFGG